MLSCTSMIATMGAMNTAITPSSDLIQQLFYEVKLLENVKVLEYTY